METETKPVKYRKLKKVLKLLFKGTLILIGLLFVYNWYWKNSGSNEWELEIDKEGVKVYSLKGPGDNTMKFKSEITGKYTLAQLAAPHILDHNLATCKEWFDNCVGCKIIKPWDSIKNYDVTLWTLDFPSPFAPRELLINTSVNQDENNVVTIDVIAVPNAIPHTEGIVRVQRMHNVWKFTPLENGMAKCELIQDISMGGLFPSLAMNMMGADANFAFMRDELPMFLKKEKYKNASFPFIEEQN